MTATGQEMNTPGSKCGVFLREHYPFLDICRGVIPCCEAPRHAGTPPLSLHVHRVKAAFVVPYFYIYGKTEKSAVSMGIPPPSVSSCGCFTPSCCMCAHSDATASLVLSATLRALDASGCPLTLLLFCPRIQAHTLTNVSLGKMPWELTAG